MPVINFDNDGGDGTTVTTGSTTTTTITRMGAGPRLEMLGTRTNFTKYVFFFLLTFLTIF